MSYAALPPRPLAPSRFGPGLRGYGHLRGLGVTTPPPEPPRSLPNRILKFIGLGTLMDANVLTSAWYLPLVEQLNQVNAARQYFWGPMKYLSNWDALDYSMGFTQYTPIVHQEATLYQWDGSQWRKTNVGSV